MPVDLIAPVITEILSKTIWQYLQPRPCQTCYQMNRQIWNLGQADTLRLTRDMTEIIVVVRSNWFASHYIQHKLAEVTSAK